MSFLLFVSSIFVIVNTPTALYYIHSLSRFQQLTLVGLGTNKRTDYHFRLNIHYSLINEIMPIAIPEQPVTTLQNFKH